MKSFKFLFFLIISILFSFSVLGSNHAPTPNDAFSSIGDAIENIYDFLKGIVIGTADVSDSNFVVFILYFILFLAIYTEGLRFLKFFGERGELNKPGKAFGFAAALLSCLALFLTNKEHVFTSLVSPFGVWGGTVIAAIIGYISYKFIKDADLFEEDVMTQMAGATAIALTFAGFLLGLNSLMGWGFLIMLLVFLVGLIRRFTFGRIGTSRRRDSEENSRETTPSGSSRPPGREPPVTRRRRKADDPPMPPSPPLEGLPPKPIGKKPKKKKKEEKIPEEEIIQKDLSKYFNPIRSQDGMGACTAFATSSCFEYVMNRLGGGGKYLSPLYLYYVARGPEGNDKGVKEVDSGSCPYVASEWLLKEGICFEDFWKFEEKSTGKWKLEPKGHAKEDAPSKKVIKIERLSRTDSEQWASEICYNDNPILVAMKWPQDVRGGFKEKFYVNDNPLFGYGGHAVVLVGYHSHYPYQGKGVKAFKIRNSWDVNWGENGYFWIEEKTLLKCMKKGHWDPIVLTGWQKHKIREHEGINKGLKSQHEILKKIKNFSSEESKWIAAEFDNLEKFNHFINSKNYSQLMKHYTQIGRSERKVISFNRKLNENLVLLIENLSPQIKKVLEEIKTELKINSDNILKYNSRYQGSIRKCLDVLKIKLKMLKNKDLTPSKRNRVNLEINHLLMQLGNSTKEVIKWSHALQINLKKLNQYISEILVLNDNNEE